MTRWVDLSTGTRVFIGLFILVVLVLLILAGIGYSTGGWESSVTEGK